MMSALASERDDDLLVVTEPYFPTGHPQRFDDGVTYASDNLIKEHVTTYQWPHSLSEIFEALLHAGLSILAFDEHTTIPWKALPSLIPTPEGYVLPSGRERLPLMFWIAARKLFLALAQRGPSSKAEMTPPGAEASGGELPPGVQPSGRMFDVAIICRHAGSRPHRIYAAARGHRRCGRGHRDIGEGRGGANRRGRISSIPHRVQRVAGAVATG